MKQVINNDILIGPVTIHMYGLMIALGILCALSICIKHARRQGIDEKHIWNIFLISIVSGFVGAKLLYVIVGILQGCRDLSLLWDIRNGYVVYGGIILGVFFSWLYCRHTSCSFLAYSDLLLPRVSFAQSFGRIGCFFAGCCYGKETASSFCIIYETSNFAPNNIPLIPAQLISASGDMLLFAVLSIIELKSPKEGTISSLWMILYGMGRFAVEFLRADARGFWGVLSTSQCISLIFICLGIFLAIKFRYRHQ